MAITTGETLSLNSLASATGQGTKSLSAAKGNTTGPISLSSFGIDGVGSISGYTYLVENTGDSYTLGFTTAGSNFSRISSRSANFTWSVPSGTTISVVNSGATSTVTAANNIGGSSQTVRSAYTNQPNTLRVVFNDGFNDHATNYNTNRDKTIYAVDSYDGNSAALCLTLDSPIIKSDGSIITAGDIEEGDVLRGFSIEGLGDDSDGDKYLKWSTDTFNQTAADVTVINTVYSFASKIYNINDGEVQATLEHPMLIKDINDVYSFKQMIDISVGDKLIKHINDGIEEIAVTSVVIDETITEVVSIDVETEDTYLVNGYITHNKGGNSFADPTPSAVTGLSYTDPLLTWSAYSGASDYRLQIDNNSDFSSPTHDYTNWSSTSIEIGDSFFGLTQGATYYARIAARDYGILGTWSSTLTFVL